MAAATAVAIAAIVATVAGAGVSAMNQAAAGKAADRLAQYNASLAEQNSAAQRRDAAIQANAIRDRNALIIAKQRAAYGASGAVIETGSPLQVQVDTAGKLELSALESQRQGNLRASQYEQQAVIDRMQGKTARDTGNLAATGTILQGVGNAAGGYAAIK